MNSYEEDIYQIAKDLLAEYKNNLIASGLQVSLLEIDPNASSLEGHTSELKIYFSDASGIYDFIEFFLFKDGKPIVDRKEVNEWLRKTIEEILGKIELLSK